MLVRRWPFKPSMVADAPDTAGVYALWDGDALLHIGRANGGDDTLRSRLSAHLERARSSGAPSPTHYSWEICGDPRAREAELAAQLSA